MRRPQFTLIPTHGKVGGGRSIQGTARELPGAIQKESTVILNFTKIVTLTLPLPEISEGAPRFFTRDLGTALFATFVRTIGNLELEDARRTRHSCRDSCCVALTVAWSPVSFYGLLFAAPIPQIEYGFLLPAGPLPLRYSSSQSLAQVVPQHSCS